MVGSVYPGLVVLLQVEQRELGSGPTASELPVKVRLAAEEITIDELLTLLTVAPVGMPCP